MKEAEIDKGRKRIDIMYTNAAAGGFFHRMATLANVVAHKVPVECKNYSKDPANPEVDQLAGRFAPNRGRLGFLVYRTTDNRERLIARCRDSAVEGARLHPAARRSGDHRNAYDIRLQRRPNIDVRLANLHNRLIH